MLGQLLPGHVKDKVHEQVALGILLVVQILFDISIACFVVLIVAATAIVHRIRRDHKRSRTPAPPQPSFGEHLNAAAEYGTLRSPRLIPHQTVQGITAKKSWDAPSHAVEIHADTPHSAVFGRHKSPQSVQAAARGSSERADWAHFNNNLGDLTDPYTSRRPAGAASSRRF